MVNDKYHAVIAEVSQFYHTLVKMRARDLKKQIIHAGRG